MEHVFSEVEKRALLAEVIKTSSIPIDKIFALITGTQAQPEWSTMVLPYGRNMNQSMRAYDDLQREFSPQNYYIGYSSPSQPAVISLPPGPALPPAHTATSHKRKSIPGLVDFPADQAAKRRQSGQDMNMTGRNIQPRPSNDSPQSYSPTASGQQGKKRGRPSKADIEARNAEAIARGEVIPPKPPVKKKVGLALAPKAPEMMAQSSTSPAVSSFYNHAGPVSSQSSVGFAPTAPMAQMAPVLGSESHSKVEDSVKTDSKEALTVGGSAQSTNMGEPSPFGQFQITSPPRESITVRAEAPSQKADVPPQIPYTPAAPKEIPMAEPQVENPRSDI